MGTDEVTRPPRSGVSPRHAMLALYRARAGHYDDELAAFEPLRAMAIDRLHLCPGQTVLDVGCGTGLSFPPLMERLGAQGHIVGIEQCPDMLARARTRLPAPLGDRVRLIQASAESAHWRGPKADAALLHFTHDIVNNPVALDAVFRHLKPGARVVATGLQWAPAWAWPINAFVLGAALYSISSLDGLQRPWATLEPRLEDFEVTPEWLGSIFMASGHRPDAPPRQRLSGV